VRLKERLLPSLKAPSFSQGSFFQGSFLLSRLLSALKAPSFLVHLLLVTPLSHVWRASFTCKWRPTHMCVAWLIHQYDVTDSRIRHFSSACVWHYSSIYVTWWFTCVTWLCTVWVWRQPFICTSHLWLDSSTCVVCLIHISHVTHSHVWPYSITCVAWLIHLCQITWPDIFMCHVTWLIAVTHSHVWHD